MSEPNDPIINEIGRMALVLPQRNDRFPWPELLAIAIDQSTEGSVHHFLRYAPDRLPFLDSTYVIHALCNDRAQRCIDGRLLVEGRPIRPERYLPLWRETARNAVPLQQFCETHRSQVTAVIKGAYDEMRTRRYQYSSIPFKAFEEVEAHYQQRLQHTADGSFVLEIDLLEPAALDHISLVATLGNQEPKARFSVDIEMPTPASLAATQFAMFPQKENAHVVSN